MISPLVVTAGVCAAGAGLEGVAAGKGVRHRMNTLVMPAYSPPFKVWVLIGAVYYATFGAMLYRLLLQRPSGMRTVAICMLVAVLLINAFWNYLFFRMK